MQGRYNANSVQTFPENKKEGILPNSLPGGRKKKITSKENYRPISIVNMCKNYIQNFSK